MIDDIRITAYAILIPQIVHSVLVLTAYRYSHGWEWGAHLFWVFLTIFAVTMEISLLEALLRLRRWVWSLMTILLVDISLYITYEWRFEDSFIQGVYAAELFLTILCFTLLVRFRYLFCLPQYELSKIVGAFILTGIVVFVTGNYIRHMNLQWGITPPRWFEIIVDSGFLKPEENLFSLSWLCYLALALLVRIFLPRSGSDEISVCSASHS
jgi:hypothetical protein